MRELFDSLNLTKWKYLQILGSGGGQAKTSDVQNVETGQIGVFRLLHEQKRGEKEIKRFVRELTILINPEYSHPAIIEILDYTKDAQNEPWYISKKGKSFKDYWGLFRTNNNPDSIVEKAVQIIRTLSEGLIKLHQNGVIHRDINPKNVVVIDEKAVLIDFGICFLFQEERISTDLVACMHGYDASSFFNDDIPTPWIDVFLLSQLLIWMVNKKPNLQGVRHWSHTNYIDGISYNNEKALRALTGKCSLPSTSPKNAGELVELIDNIFVTYPVNQNENDRSMSSILSVVSKNKNDTIAQFNDAFEEILSNIGLFTTIANQFEEGMVALADEMRKNEFKVQLLSNNTVKQFEKKYFESTQLKFESNYNSGTNYLNLNVESFTLHCQWTYMMYTNGAIGTNWNYRMYLAYAVCDPLDKLGRIKDPNRYIVPRNDGRIDLYDGNLNLLMTTTLPDILASIKEDLLDEKNWEIVSQ